MRKVRGVSPAGYIRKTRFERWLAAVLIADVVGYTRLIERDEVDAHARVSAIQRELLLPHVKRRGGRVVKTTGDGVVAEFRSSLDAVVCAVLVQKAMLELNKDVVEEDRIVLRMGLSAGEVIHDEGDIYGKTVIVAARLQALSPAGGICVSRVVRDHLRDKVPLPLADLGEQQVKNLARPLRAFEIRAEAIASTVFDAELIGKPRPTRNAGHGAPQPLFGSGRIPVTLRPRVFDNHEWTGTLSRFASRRKFRSE